MIGVLSRLFRLLVRDNSSIDECNRCGNWARYGNLCPDCIEENRQDLQQ